MQIINNLNGKVDVNTIQYGKSIIAFYIGGITGSLMILSISGILGNFMNKFIFTISSGTLATYWF